MMIMMEIITTTTTIIIISSSSSSSFKVSANGLFRFRTYESLWTFGKTPWTGGQPDARPLPTQDNTTQKKCGHTSMPRAGFEPAIPMFERPKTVRALDRAANGTGHNNNNDTNNNKPYSKCYVKDMKKQSTRARNWAPKAQKTGTHTNLSLYLSMKI
jgi:hypothetical protein